VEYPAGYDSVIAVTATDALNVPAYVSPMGEELELSAPGVDVLSTVTGGSYDFLSGTSQAAPHVTGVVALSILSNTKDISGDGIINHEDVRLMLQMSAIDLGDAGKDEIYGYGLVDGAAAAFAPETTLLATRTLGSPKLDAQLTRVTDVPYEITIKNSDLNMVTVDVFEDDVLRRDLSGSFHFGAQKPQEVVLVLDATGTRHSVLFTPYGRRGASAEIVFRLNTQPAGE
jgi:subtilisin